MYKKHSNEKLDHLSDGAYECTISIEKGNEYVKNSELY